ncbi:hypothetical protein E1B28_007825 [Marasmius oreades]|uniref:Uncharacterized protein n=1 Tax=Marasmius oreades TaxID=181124 RepID=A0A9P7UU61_9AGAR|nr:uncharacterized protein E1B28_007825 [Marasmius oreades]KAG7094218.1 hypothetical protein E1B28_007825 [Marasmius oreades]
MEYPSVPNACGILAKARHPFGPRIIANTNDNIQNDIDKVNGLIAIEAGSVAEDRPKDKMTEQVGLVVTRIEG